MLPAYVVGQVVPLWSLMLHATRDSALAIAALYLKRRVAGVERAVSTLVGDVEVVMKRTKLASPGSASVHVANAANATNPADPNKVIRMAFEAADNGFDMATTSSP